MNILVTGSNGFIGKRVYFKLKKKNNTKKLIFHKLSHKENLNDIKKDIEKKLKKFKPKIIVHCATFFSKEKNLYVKKKTLRVNFEIPKILIDLADQNNVKKFINIGSTHEFVNDKKKFYPYLSTKKKFSNYLIKKKFKLQIFSIYIFNSFGKNDKRQKLLDLLIEQKKKLKIYKNLQLNFLNVETISKFISNLENFKTEEDKKLVYLANKNFLKIKSLKKLNLKKIKFLKKPAISLIEEHKIKIPFKGIFFSSSIDNSFLYIKKNLNKISL